MNIDIKIKKLVKNPDALAIMDKYIPGFSTDKQLKLAYGMTVREMYEFPQMADFRDKLDDLNAELEALPE